MASNRTRRVTPAATSAPQRAPLDLPILRVESQYRKDTLSLSHRERDKYSNLLWNIVRLDMGPRVTISQVTGPNNDAPINNADEAKLNASIAYYQKRADSTELVPVLKFYATYLLQQARKEPRPERQQILLFKVADFARMIVHHSPMSVNSDAEALVFGVFVALGKAFGEPFIQYSRHEERIFQIMRRLTMIPQDITVRLKLAEAMTEQTSFLDALVQYHTLLRVLARRGPSGNRHKGWVLARIGEVFQKLSNISSSRLKDARKLRTFIDRFNRDFSDRAADLPRLTQINVSQVTQVRNALMREANRWMVQAANTTNLERRQRLRSTAQAAENLLALSEPKEALRVLEQNMSLWTRVAESPNTLKEQSTYLRLLTGAAMHLKRRDVMERANRQISDVSAKLAVIETRRRDHEQVRAALLG